MPMPKDDLPHYAGSFINSDKKKINARKDLKNPQGQELIENPDFLRQDDFGAAEVRDADQGATPEKRKHPGFIE